MSSVGTEICARQNSEKGLKLLAARQETFRQARQLFLLQAILMVALPLVAWIIVTVIGDGRPMVASAILLITIVDILALDPKYREKINSAAVIAQEFDCFVFNIPFDNLFVKNPEEVEVIAERAQTWMENQSDDKIRDWYSVNISRLPAPFASLVCQRTNVTYDKKLRSTYRFLIFLTLIFLLTAMSVVTLTINQTLSFLGLYLCLPAAPLIIWSFREWRRQKQAIDEAERLQTFVEGQLIGLLTHQISPAIAEGELRQLQNAIYQWRSSNPLSFPGIYQLRRSKLEVNMNNAAIHWAKQYEEKSE